MNPDATTPVRVRVYVVTYRRPRLLERALRSLIRQTHEGWVAEVLNDDPSDLSVSQVIEGLGDSRIFLSQPPMHRGGTGNFNRAFSGAGEPLASILEDDNWWEPEFLSTMVAALGRHPESALACGNEHVWKEDETGAWTDTGRNIWTETEGESLLGWNALDQCGSSRLCNSSMLFRTPGSEKWRTPESIPIDVTEHFRERVTPHPILLVHRPLVNFGQTLVTNRVRGAGSWAGYQVMLVGSVLALAHMSCRRRLAEELWGRARSTDPFLATTLVATGLIVPDAGVLWDMARFPEKARFAAGLVRHPWTAASVFRVLSRRSEEWAWLQKGAFADFMAGDRTFAANR
jgi:hypothetical protein